MPKGKPTKRTLEDGSLHLDRQATKAVVLFRRFTGTSDAPNLDAFATALASIALRSLFKRFVNRPKTKGFLPILETAICPNVEAAEKLSRIFHVRYQEKSLPEELSAWLESNFRKRSPSSTSDITFRRLVGLLRTALNQACIRLKGEPLTHTVAAVESIISHEALLPATSFVRELPQTAPVEEPAAFVPSVEQNTQASGGAVLFSTPGQVTSPSLAVVVPSVAEETGPVARRNDDVTLEEEVVTVGDRSRNILSAVNDVYAALVSQTEFPATVLREGANYDQATCFPGRVIWPASWKKSWNPNWHSVSALPQRKTRQPELRPVPARFAGYEQQIEPKLQAISVNSRAVDANGKTVAAVAAGNWGLSGFAQESLSACLRAWKADPRAGVLGGALHYGVKCPPGGTKPQTVMEIERCGPSAKIFLRRLEQQLLISGALGLLEEFAAAVSVDAFQKQLAVFEALSGIKDVDLPMGTYGPFCLSNRPKLPSTDVS